MFTVGHTYTREDIYNLLGLSDAQRGGDWLNGYHRHNDDYYIFCNVGVPGRTGHDYDNHWEGEKLVWHGKTKSHFQQPAIQNLASGKHSAFIFYRTEDRAPFIYAGKGTPIPNHSIEKPARIDWIFGSDISHDAPVYTDEYPNGSSFYEGQRTQVFVNRFERDRRARDLCIKHHGSICGVCEFNFELAYGELGKGFIHVHHKTPLSEIGENYQVDPVKDLVPVCPNCHAMLHRRTPPLSLQELMSMLKK